MTTSGFDAGASPPIKLRIAQARRIRPRFPLAREVDNLPPLIPDPDWDVVMEIIGLEGLFRFVSLAVKGSEVKMLTNFTLRGTGVRAYLGPPAAALTSTLVLAQSVADDINDKLRRLQYAEGGGGDETGFDGEVHFLTLRSPAKVVRMALYFYQYPATAYEWDVPDGIDGPRWQAINTIYEIWRDLLTNPIGAQP
jgi:hypothetical protein